VRIRVRAGDQLIARDGTGYGYGTWSVPGAAHEKAAKEAETDATKRALVTFGNRFGLALYDPQQRGVTRRRRSSAKPKIWTLRSGNGQPITRHRDPVAFTKELLQQIQLATAPESLEELWRQNRSEVQRLQRLAPVLCDRSGRHYSDGLTETFKERLKSFEIPNSDDPGNNKEETGGREPAPVSLQKKARRVRDKQHLAFVAQQPCAICDRSPSQAHHLRHAQPRAMGLKVSNEYVVPLCNTHHRSMHEAGDEAHWWAERKQDPFALAPELWGISHELTGAPPEED
jgi:hypothetical protein